MKAPWAPHRTGRALHKCLVATRRIHARSDRPAEKVHVWFLLPGTEPGQVVEDLECLPPPQEILTDEFGRKIAHFYFPRIPAGRAAIARWTARISTAPVVFPVSGGPRPGKAAIPGRIRRLYLADGPYYGIRSPYIRKTAEKIRGDERDPARLVRKIVLYLETHLSYEMTGGWDDAATVLRRGTGSCSEYTYSFIALCRAMGIPARFVGATMCRRRDEPSFDWAHHRWAEAFLPGRGWVQADPLRRDCLGPRSFTISSPRCVLGHGDGGKGPLGWRYTSTAKAQGRPDITEEFFWCEDPGPGIYRKVLDLSSRPGKSAPTPAEAAEALSRIPAEMTFPFLADLLGEGDGKVLEKTARALCRISLSCAREIRYRFRRSRPALGALTAALAGAMGRKDPPVTGKWIGLFPFGKGPTLPPRRRGPFAVRKGILTNRGKPGRILFSYVAGDRFLLDFRFRTEGAGNCALLLARDGRGKGLRLPFHPPEPGLRKRNYLQGTSAGCRRGLYAVKPGSFHRGLVVMDLWRASFYLDGKKVLEQKNPPGGLGRIGFSVRGNRTTLAVSRLRILEVPENGDAGDFLEDPGLEIRRD